MPTLDYQTIKASLEAQPLFEDKTWRLSPEAWPLTPAQLKEIEQIGQACRDFYLALDILYRRSWEGKNLLRNKELVAPWVADYLDRGKPMRVIEHARHPQFKGFMPQILRPDLLLTEDGFALTEMDSVPGGIGLTDFLNGLYAEGEDDAVIGGADGMRQSFYRALAATAPDKSDPLIAVVVSDEAVTYRPEFEYLAARLREEGKRVYVYHPTDIMPLGRTLCVNVDGNPEPIDIIYRFFELFDLGNVSTAQYILEAAESGDVVVTPPMKAFQEEKLNLALLHHHVLDDFWRENLPKRSYKTLKKIVPHSWIMDPVELPPNAVLDAPHAQGKPIRRWEELGEATQKERNLIIKASGFHELAWGARSVVLGSDVSKGDWQEGIANAVEMADSTLHVLQDYHKPKRTPHPVYNEEGKASAMEGRLRLCPFYMIEGDAVSLNGILATFCPAEKKIIHGMRDAAMLPCRALPAADRAG
ncbi:MAG: hypothetical protein ACQKBW_09360 [Puniceicoccales bacterium]